MPPGVTGQSALPAPGSVSAIGDPQLASPQGSISGLSGSAADSAAPTGRAPDGSTGNSAPAINGASPNDSTLSAGPFYAAPFNGTAFDAAPFDGTASHGTPFNGPPFDGTASHGGPFNGAAFDGTASHGAPFNGAAFDGAAFGGPVPSSGASTGASEAPDGVPGSSAVHHGRLPELDAEPPLAPPPFRPGAQQVSGPPRLDFPSADFGRPQEPGPAESWLTGPPPTDPLPRRVPGVFGGGPLPSGSPARGAHADRGPQFANLEPAESQPDAGDRPAEHDEPERHVLRVPDAPTWEPHRANGYPHRENGRNRH
jgi:hypothetical protein